MNSAQIHLALNHAPLFACLLGGILLLVSLVKKSVMLQMTALVLLVAGALITVPVFLTGEGTEELAEHLPGVSDAAMEKHEDMAKITLVIIAITGSLALLALLLRRKQSIQRILAILTIMMAFVSFGAMAQTAHLGGMIRHSEISGNTGPGDNRMEDDD